MDWIRSIYGLAAAFAIGCVIVSLVAARSPRGRHITAQIAALRPLVGVLCVFASGIGLLVGRPLPAGGLMVVGLMTIGTSSAVRLRRRSRSESTSGSVSVLTVNVLVTNPRFDELLRDLNAEYCDVILLQEITRAHGAALERSVSGWPGAHVLAEPREDFSGWAIVSRHPIIATERMLFAGRPLVSADIHHPSGTIRWVNVHAAAPQTSADHTTWSRQLEALGRFADPDVPTVLAGDFNATNQHRDFRRLLARGFEDAFDTVGHGWGATWPVGRGITPVLRLDHVLVNASIEVNELESFSAVGSDHRGLRAVLSTREPGARMCSAETATTGGAASNDSV